ncbi:glycoside hydrolase family 114 protein [Gonapodya prolifera JEL478]|uniref:alpha-galactosidase n=1 Tax=Gonapodya prolifera (strain JEL478) TaxID=1344416 RepID=A0A139ALI6_GONPJ|nr:glycoside hydrolase family 114 protein [Gonapodya prolifera JEL478]|eukprot:KXS17656.1 glycoside hydrolase family 114 protein [Gonapodya prolifera JEL478]
MRTRALPRTLAALAAVAASLPASVLAQVAPPNPLPKITPGTSFQIQLSGTVDTSPSLLARVHEVDLFDTSASTVSQLKSAGAIVICYFSAGSSENWRPDFASFPAAVMGSPLDGWPGENWLDVRNIDALGPIMTNRLMMAKNKGCDGVDPDNVDGYNNPTGFPLSSADQLRYNRFIADAAHSNSLLVALKNCQALGPQLVPWYDFAVTEQCAQYEECDSSSPFVKANKAVFNIEYNLDVAAFCSSSVAMNIDAQLKKLALDAPRTFCRQYAGPVPVGNQGAISPVSAPAAPAPTSTAAAPAPARATTTKAAVVGPVSNAGSTTTVRAAAQSQAAAPASSAPAPAPASNPSGAAPTGAVSLPSTPSNSPAPAPAPAVATTTRPVVAAPVPPPAPSPAAVTPAAVASSNPKAQKTKPAKTTKIKTTKTRKAKATKAPTQPVAPSDAAAAPMDLAPVLPTPSAANQAAAVPTAAAKGTDTAGTLTWYQPNGGTGACWMLGPISNDELSVALSYLQFNPALCGRSVCITYAPTSQTVRATVKDLCPDVNVCKMGHLNGTPGVWKALGIDTNVGYISNGLTWREC